MFHERYKNFQEVIFKKTGNYIQQPIDIGVCEVNLRPPTSRILADYFSRAESVPKTIENMEIRGVYCPLFNVLLC